MSGQVLSGYSVLVTRPEHQCDDLISQIRKAGGEPLIAPMLGIRGIADNSHGVALLQHLQDFEIAVFVSRNAVDYAFKLLAAEKIALTEIEIYAVGLGTAAQLTAHGVSGVHTPRGTFNSEGLLELPGLAPARVIGKRVVIFSGRDGRELLAEALKGRGATVEYCEVYERYIPDTHLKEVLKSNRGNMPDVAVVTSLEGLQNLAAKIADEGVDAFYDVPLLVASARIAEEVAKLGFTTDPVIVEHPGDGCIVSALIEWAGGEP